MLGHNPFCRPKIQSQKPEKRDQYRRCEREASCHGICTACCPFSQSCCCAIAAAAKPGAGRHGAAIIARGWGCRWCGQWRWSGAGATDRKQHHGPTRTLADRDPEGEEEDGDSKPKPQAGPSVGRQGRRSAWARDPSTGPRSCPSSSSATRPALQPQAVWTTPHRAQHPHQAGAILEAALSHWVEPLSAKQGWHACTVFGQKAEAKERRPRSRRQRRGGLRWWKPTRQCGLKHHPAKVLGGKWLASLYRWPGLMGRLLAATSEPKSALLSSYRASWLELEHEVRRWGTNKLRRETVTTRFHQKAIQVHLPPISNI